MGWTFYNSSGQRFMGRPANMATQAQMEAASSTTTHVTPGRAHYHPGVAKAWVKIATAGTIVAGSYNTDSITDTGVGDRTIVWDVDFSSTAYVANSTDGGGNTHNHQLFNAYAVGSVRLVVTDISATFRDYDNDVVAHGDQ
tara:strand:+ start:246 stop:668 length:423 start_codon:yes stop_codon:yes gene_type:complete